MKSKILTMIMLGLAVATTSLTVSPVTLACSSAKDCVTSGVTAAGGSTSSTTSLSSILKTITNVLLFVVGAVAVIMIIVGGLRYVTSQGDQGNLQSAKNTILYAVVGLIVAIMAYAIVNFVVTQFVK